MDRPGISGASAFTNVNDAGRVENIRASDGRSRPMMVRVNGCPRSAPRGCNSVIPGPPANAAEQISTINLPVAHALLRPASTLVSTQGCKKAFLISDSAGFHHL